MYFSRLITPIGEKKVVVFLPSNIRSFVLSVWRSFSSYMYGCLGKALLFYCGTPYFECVYGLKYSRARARVTCNMQLFNDDILISAVSSFSNKNLNLSDPAAIQGVDVLL